ncbi:MAG: 5-methyltetrahydropteroyltriglutamate--homocysteine methyltransferase, partial [Bacteroidetes bacterium QH_2_64_26]
SHDDQTIFLGVIDVNNPRMESAEEVRDTVLQAAEHLPVDQLGTTDDCGFSPFGDDRSTARRMALRKIAARVEGTEMASEALGIDDK